MFEMARFLKPNKNVYLQVLINEELQNLGDAIHAFRNLRNTVSKSSSSGLVDIEPASLFLLDSIYQDLFDRVMDSLANMNDLKMANTAISAIDKSIKVRRGIIKKDTVK